MELKVYGQDGQEAGRTVTLEASVFDAVPNDHAIWLDVRRIQANARQGTHKVKERSENAHSTRKLYRQKGTGFARAGDAKSPIRKGGGTMFGPRPRTYDMKINKKTQRLARRSVLTYKAREEAIRVVEAFTFDGPKTRALKDLLGRLNLTGRKVLLLTAGHSPAIHRSSTNLAKVRVLPAASASTFDLLAAQVILLQEDALDVLTRQLGEAAAETA
jgi:large subunit ribosomal protein L4